MADQVSQNYANHRRYVPLYHFVLALLVLANLAFACVHLYLHHTWGALVGLLVALALLTFFWYARSFPEVIQDRVIRLEESLRYQKVLPADLQSRTGQLTLRQIIGLRFASDAELPALVRRALDEKLSENQIKKEVKSWRADMLRV
ncbi:MAG: DUF6526 family protein [Gemmatimonadales bacterium]